MNVSTTVTDFYGVQIPRIFQLLARLRWWSSWWCEELRTIIIVCVDVCFFCDKNEEKCFRNNGIPETKSMWVAANSKKEKKDPKLITRWSYPRSSPTKSSRTPHRKGLVRLKHSDTREHWRQETKEKFIVFCSQVIHYYTWLSFRSQVSYLQD